MSCPDCRIARSGHPVQNADKLGTGQGTVWGENRIAHANHKTAIQDKINTLMVPGRAVQILKVLRRTWEDFYRTGLFQLTACTGAGLFASFGTAGLLGLLPRTPVMA